MNPHHAFRPNETPCGRTRREFLWQAGAGFAGLGLIDLLLHDGFFASAHAASHPPGVTYPYATHACVDTWLTDFRPDVAKIDVPILVVHGTEDRILPYESTAARLPALIDDLELVTIEGGPHNVGWTHPDEVNKALLEFLAD